MEASNMALLNNAISAHDVAVVTEMVLKNQHLAKGSDQFPVFEIPAEKMVEINKLLGRSPNAPRPHRLAKRDLIFDNKLAQHRARLEKRGAPNVFTYVSLHHLLVLVVSTSPHSLKTFTCREQIRWSFMDTHLASLKMYLQDWVSFTTEVALMAPIYSDKGLGASLSGGAFLASNPSWITLEAQSKKLGYISLISDILVSLVCTPMSFWFFFFWNWSTPRSSFWRGDWWSLGLYGNHWNGKLVFFFLHHDGFPFFFSVCVTIHHPNQNLKYQIKPVFWWEAIKSQR